MKKKTRELAAWGWKAIKPHLPDLLFWAVAIWLTFELYAASSAKILLQRGYKAVGGEVFIWLLPSAAYAIKRWIVEVLKRREPLDADYVPVLEPVKLEDLAVATVKLSGVMAAVGVSAEDAAAAFRALETAVKETA